MEKLEELSIVRLNIQLTKRCNQRCRSCNSYKMDGGNELTLKEVEAICQDVCGKYDIKNIAFTGGEPTFYRGVVQAVEIASKFSKNVSITTNGYYFKTRDKLMELLDNGLNRFSFSYHGIGKHDIFTNTPGAEERLRNVIEWMYEERKIRENVYAKIGMLFNGKNISDIGQMLDYAESKNMDLYIEILDYFIPIFKNSEEAINHSVNQQNHEEIEKGLGKIEEWIRKKRRVRLDDKGIEFIRRYYSGETIKGKCPLGLTDIYVESDGNIRTGCWSMEPVGNIRKSTLTQILDSERYRESVAKMLRRECTGCTCGYLMQAKYME